MVELLKENLGAAGVVEPARAAAEELGVEDPPNKLPPALPTPGNRPPVLVVAGLL